MFTKIIAWITRTEKTVESIAEGFFSTITKLEQHAERKITAAALHANEALTAHAKAVAASDEGQRATELAAKIKNFVA